MLKTDVVVCLNKPNAEVIRQTHTITHTDFNDLMRQLREMAMHLCATPIDKAYIISEKYGISSCDATYFQRIEKTEEEYAEYKKTQKTQYMDSVELHFVHYKDQSPYKYFSQAM